jgi:hypothetical protein
MSVEKLPTMCIEYSLSNYGKYFDRKKNVIFPEILMLTTSLLSSLFQINYKKKAESLQFLLHSRFDKIYKYHNFD